MRNICDLYFSFISDIHHGLNLDVSHWILKTIRMHFVAVMPAKMCHCGVILLAIVTCLEIMLHVTGKSSDEGGKSCFNT